MSDSKVWTKEEISKNMEVSIKWLYHGLLAIYRNQTSDEIQNGVTKHSNGCGFTSYDASFLTSLAEQILNGRYLSMKQVEILRKKMKKYSGQLARIANA